MKKSDTYNLTHYHSKFFANKITLSGHDEEGLAKSLTSARVDINPHQVEAALFALKSPISKGVLLADEVGLGKTIEASLVIAQKWAERKRRILLIVPASLRKQWAQELLDKFSLKSRILDAKKYKEFAKGGVNKPFDTQQEIVISSYEFAARNSKAISSVEWDMVVYDEAHKLRNVREKSKDKGKIAKTLKKALANPFKLLLTATPLQNKLLDLHGIVSIIDEFHFGSEIAFNIAKTNKNETQLKKLQKRLKPICTRTLRKEVRDTGHIKYTKRKTKTFDFKPEEDEERLYHLVSKYLRRSNTVAFGQRLTPLIILVARKILGSSTVALAQFLDRVIQRLETNLESNEEDLLEDIEIADAIAEERDDEKQVKKAKKINKEQIKDEIEELTSFRDLALSIEVNAKGKELMAQLPRVMKEIVKKGGKHKAVIFTGSLCTQKHLAQRLNGMDEYKGKVVLMNGSNSDPESREIYKAWREKNIKTNAFSGSSTADTKSAIVDAFKGDGKSILIATESGAEGINLQFCSLVVNFDLPWNPQRVEQRIGRCHRYGQELDVLVVNLLNIDNLAEKRIFELLRDKFNLFSGVFGASDTILGAIENGVNFEKTVLEIIQASPTDKEVQRAFDELQNKLKEEINEEIKVAHNKVLREFDEEIVSRLRMRESVIGEVLDKFTQHLMIVAKAELPEAIFHKDDKTRFDYEDTTWSTNWDTASKQGWSFFRLSDKNLASTVVSDAKRRLLPKKSLNLRFSLSSYDRLLSDVKELQNQSGWLRVSKLSVNAADTLREKLIISCFNENTLEIIQNETAEKFFLLKAKEEKLAEKLNIADQKNIDQKLENEETKLIEGFRINLRKQGQQWLGEVSDKLDAYAEDIEKSLENEKKMLGADIKKAKKKLNKATKLSIMENVQERRRIMRMEEEFDKKSSDVVQARRDTRKKVSGMLQRVGQSLDKEIKIEHLFTIKWSIDS